MSKLCRECDWYRNGTCHAAHVPDPANRRGVVRNRLFLTHVVHEPSCTQWLSSVEGPYVKPRRKIAP